jgi:AcrR family transcriptional regulator
MPNAIFNKLPEEKRQRVLDAAVKEFSERNLPAANISNIVKEAKIARGSIYQYFNSKEDLYIYVFDTLRRRRAEYVEPAFILYKKEPFLDFFQEFYLRDSEFLLMNPTHIELGKQLYCGTDRTSIGLIQQLQTRYKELFIVAIEFDKERGLIDRGVSGSVLTDLCVHFVTDIFIFQSIHNQLSIDNIRNHWLQTRRILQNGIKPENNI